MIAERRRVRVALVPPQGDTPELDYLLTDDRAVSALGSRVIVPLGRRRATAVVVEELSSEVETDDSLREILCLVDTTPVLDQGLLDLCRWMANYYVSQLGNVLETALPAGLRLRFERSARRIDGDISRLRPEDRTLLSLLDARGGSASFAALRAESGGGDITRSFKRLERAALIEVEEIVAGETGPTRTEQQVTILRTLSDAEEANLQRRRRALYSLYLQLQAQGGGPLPVKSFRRSVPT